MTRGSRYGCGTGGAWWWGEAVMLSKCGCWWAWWKRRDGAAEFAGARWGASRAHLAGGGSDGHALRVGPAGGAGAGGDWGESAERASVCVSLAAGRPIENLALGRRRLCAVVQAAGERRVPAAAGRKRERGRWSCKPASRKSDQQNGPQKPVDSVRQHGETDRHDDELHVSAREVFHDQLHVRQSVEPHRIHRPGRRLNHVRL